jgi:hypothetical protein
MESNEEKRAKADPFYSNSMGRSRRGKKKFDWQFQTASCIRVGQFSEKKKGVHSSCIKNGGKKRDGCHAVP